MIVIGALVAANKVPFWLRSRRSINREIALQLQAYEDPSLTGKGPKTIVDEAIARRYKLYQIINRRAWQRLWPYLVLGFILVLVAIFLFLHR
jgi:hypothetical protein